MSALKTVIVVAFAFAAGFLSGAMCLRKTYIDMPSYGWWEISESSDGYKLMSNGCITIKMLEIVEGKEREVKR